jgi:hypothetical protein
MRLIRIFVIAALAALFFVGVASYAAQNDNTSSTVTEKAPSAVLPLNKWEFESVVDGTAVVHEFVIQNKGDAPLNISKVKTG